MKKTTKKDVETPEPMKDSEQIEPGEGDPLRLEVDGLIYLLDRPPSKGGRKVVVEVLLAGGEKASLVDRADLYAFRARQRLAGIVADTFGRDTGTIMGHLAALLDRAERAHLVEKKTEPLVLTQARTRAAEKLLASKNFLDKIVKALDALGLVGEERNKRALYLIATSRLLDRSLSALLRAPAATGKSELLDAVISLMPEEQVEAMTRLTPHALFYAGEEALKHKLVVVDEQPGASEADHPIRVLQSSGKLTLAVVVKGKTERFNVRGPISMLSGTTAATGNIENTSRCLELTLDDSPEQTRRIQEVQRRAWAGEERQALDLQGFKDAQRLLEPLPVVIPFATKLTFPSRGTTDRRDQPKLLGLTASHALLYQRQRKRDSKGRVVATVDDYRTAFEVFAPLVEAEFEDLSSRAAHLYRLLKKERARGCDGAVSKRGSRARARRPKLPGAFSFSVRGAADGDEGATAGAACKDRAVETVGLEGMEFSPCARADTRTRERDR